jgi:hypothetical protein
MGRALAGLPSPPPPRPPLAAGGPTRPTCCPPRWSTLPQPWSRPTQRCARGRCRARRWPSTSSTWSGWTACWGRAVSQGCRVVWAGGREAATWAPCARRRGKTSPVPHIPELPPPPAAPPSLRGDIDTGYALLAQRIAAGGTNGAGPATPLGRSLAAVQDPAELNKKWVSSGGWQGLHSARPRWFATLSVPPPLSLANAQAAGHVPQAPARYPGALHVHAALPLAGVTAAVIEFGAAAEAGLL